ncbi:sulfatase-like hydrolase/transferase [Endozoicomonas arenosclerae]|uniref:sulfatase-like hydrolase/transferase n=1 Tax=Endozoicomonas arenosclerae TaxID=1633495 RepID=UPI0007819B59|nr:sulfatase-like hydrolase/transferase [Endozoicomonas arenosclerae]
MKVRSLLAGLSFTFLSSQTFANSEQPNILLIVADDLGWADVGFHGAEIETPSLDQLAREGAQLDRFYVAPTCSPTRAALMTGRDPMRLGVAYATVMPWSNFGVKPDEKFMSEAFQSAGYQTGIFGKWHLGNAQEAYTPQKRGFDYFYGHLNTEVGYYPPYNVQGGKDFQRNGKTIPENETGYETDMVSSELSRWIKERDKDKPFFAYLPYLAPHTPLEAPQSLIAKYKHLKDDKTTSLPTAKGVKKDSTNVRPVYAAMVDAMDQGIGRILKTLDEEGLADNTIVMFFSDNGGPIYGGAGAKNLPLRGGKGNTFEGGIRVPSVIRWPEKINAGQTIEDIITVMDIFPTLSAAASIKTGNTRPLDGKSMLPALLGKPVPPRKDLVFFTSETPIRNSFSLTAFNDDWKLVQQIKQGFTQTEVKNHLFKIHEDPYEKNNLAEKHPEVVARLSQSINTWRMLYPLNGIRSNIVPPPGWKAPLDWTLYPTPDNQLQKHEAFGQAPNQRVKIYLDVLYGEAGRLIYDCIPQKQGPCKPNL